MHSDLLRSQGCLIPFSLLMPLVSFELYLHIQSFSACAIKSHFYVFCTRSAQRLPWSATGLINDSKRLGGREGRHKEHSHHRALSVPMLLPAGDKAAVR
jgi:hypothetical protein